MNPTGFLVFVRSALIACTWGLASLLGGCGGSSDGVGEPITSVSAPVGATGGALELQGLALTLPANAIPETINLSITALTAGTGEIARFRLSPAGLALSSPAELRFSSAGMPAKASFFWDVGGELRLVPSLLVGDVLTAQILSLGLGSAGNTVSALGTSQTGLKRALAARPLAAPADDGGIVVVKPLDCAADIATMAARLKRVAASDDSEAVIRAFDEIVAAKQLCLEAEIQALRDRSCEALDVAQLKAQTLVASSFKSFQELTLPLIAAEAFVQKTGADCPSADSALVGPLIADKFDQFLRILQAQQLRGVFAEKATLKDIQELLSYQVSCARLGLDEICERLDNEIFPNLFDGMRSGAFDECRSSGSPLVVSQLHFLGTWVTDTSTFLGFGRFGMADLEADMSYCTNPSLELRVFADAAGRPEELTDRASTLRPLVGLGNYVRSTTVAVPRDGKLTVSGELAALRCADDTVSPADLVVRIGSQEVARRSVSGNAYPLSTAPLDLVIGEVLASAGLDPAQTDGFILNFNREGGQCLGALGPTLGESFTVFEVQVNLPTGPLELRGSVVLSLKTTTTAVPTDNGSTNETVVIVNINAPVKYIAGQGLVLQSAGFSGSKVRTVKNVFAVESRSPCFFDAVTDRVERTTIAPRGGTDFGYVGFSLTNDSWVLADPTLPVTERKTTTTTRTTTNVRGDCSRTDLSSTTSTDVSPAKSSTLDLLLSLTNTPAFQGTLSRDVQGLRSLAFSDRLVQKDVRFDPSKSVTTSVLITLQDQPAP